MRRTSRQKAILENLEFQRDYGPWIDHSSFVLVRFMMSKSPSDFDKYSDKQVRKSLYDLKKQKYIKEKITKVTNDNEEGVVINFELTKKGKELLKNYKFSDLIVPEQKDWDKEWRFIIFDIPEKYRNSRDILRDKIKKMDFFQIQQSVWAHPYECKKEMEFLLEFLGLERYVLLFTTKISKDERLREYYRRKGYSM